jgi:hypothetical protein
MDTKSSNYMKYDYASNLSLCINKYGDMYYAAELTELAQG